MSESLRIKYAPQPERGIDWRDRAACLSSDPELFFPIGTTGPAEEQIKRARRICRDCPVIMECLRNALRTTDQYGIAGGLTEGERRKKRKDIQDGKIGKAALIEFINSKISR